MQEWNKLPDNITQENSKIIFKKLVKKHLFAMEI